MNYAVDDSVMQMFFVHDCAVPFGAEIIDYPSSKLKVLKKYAVTVCCFFLIVLLHLIIAEMLQTARGLKRLDVEANAIGQDGGQGGISVQLVSGRFGADFAGSTAVKAIDPGRERGAILEPEFTTPASPVSTGDSGEETTPSEHGHSVGGLNEGLSGGAVASAGSGYDPGAYASLAPSSFSQSSEPGFWEQVKRCFVAQPPTKAVGLNVVLDSSGVFIDAYRSPGAVATNQSADDIRTVSNAVQALQACSPYHDLEGGLAKRLVLVVPAGG